MFLIIWCISNYCYKSRQNHHAKCLVAQIYFRALFSNQQNQKGYKKCYYHYTTYTFYYFFKHLFFSLVLSCNTGDTILDLTSVLYKKFTNPPFLKLNCCSCFICRTSYTFGLLLYSSLKGMICQVANIISTLL